MKCCPSTCFGMAKRECSPGGTHHSWQVVFTAKDKQDLNEPTRKLMSEVYREQYLMMDAKFQEPHIKAYYATGKPIFSKTLLRTSCSQETKDDSGCLHKLSTWDTKEKVD